MSEKLTLDPAPKTFDDFEQGEVLVTRGRTINASDLIAFAGLTGDYYPLHIDEEYAQTTRFGTRLAHGPFTFAIAVGLVGLSNFYGDAIIALIEVQGLRALKPVKPGDTLHVRAVVASKESAENPKYGTLAVDYSVINQDDVEVMKFRQLMLARRDNPKEIDQ